MQRVFQCSIPGNSVRQEGLINDKESKRATLSKDVNSVTVPGFVQAEIALPSAHFSSPAGMLLLLCAVVRILGLSYL